MTVMTQIPQAEILMDAPDHDERRVGRARQLSRKARVATAEKRRCATPPKPRA